MIHYDIVYGNYIFLSCSVLRTQHGADGRMVRAKSMFNVLEEESSFLYPLDALFLRAKSKSLRRCNPIYLILRSQKHLKVIAESVSKAGKSGHEYETVFVLNWVAILNAN